MTVEFARIFLASGVGFLLGFVSAIVWVVGHGRRESRRRDAFMKNILKDLVANLEDEGKTKRKPRAKVSK